MAFYFNQDEKRARDQANLTNLLNVISDAYNSSRKNSIEQSQVPQENALRQAQTNFYNRYSQTGGMGGIDTVNTPPDELINHYANSFGVDPTDLTLEPKTITYRGIPSVIQEPKYKPKIPNKELAQVQLLQKTADNLVRNVGLIDEDVKKYMNPMDIRGSRTSGLNALGNFILKIQSMPGGVESIPASKFATFKAETDKIFQAFRKDTTGAQAALKELNWLAPDYPEPNDPPDLYLRKSYEALQRIAEGEELLLRANSEAGYRTGDLKKSSVRTKYGSILGSGYTPEPPQDLIERARMASQASPVAQNGQQVNYGTSQNPSYFVPQNQGQYEYKTINGKTYRRLKKNG